MLLASATHPYQRLLRCCCLGWLIVYQAQAFAGDKHSVADTASLPPFTLSPAQIKKLDHFFQQTAAPADRVPSFSAEVVHEHRVWRQQPLTIILPVGKERMVNFPKPVEWGYDKSSLPESSLRVQNNAGTLYLLAKAPFPSQRVFARLPASGDIILVDLSAQPEAEDTPLDIVLSSPTTDNHRAPSPREVNNSERDQELPVNNALSHAVALTRFALQQLYAPKRLLTQPPMIHRLPMHTAKTVSVVNDGSVIAMPLASWRWDDSVVTALFVRNTLKQPLRLTPSSFCGAWQAATLYPRDVLSPAGSLADSTTVFLMADHSFQQALQACGASV